jgi:hypothetical protein
MPTPQKLNQLSLRTLENGITSEMADKFKSPVDNTLKKSTDRVLCPREYDNLYNNIFGNTVGLEIATPSDKNYIQIKALFKSYPVFDVELLEKVTGLMGDDKRKTALRQNAHIFFKKKVFTVST